MVISINKRFIVRGFCLAGFINAFVLLSFKTAGFKSGLEAVIWSNSSLRQNFDPSADMTMRRWDVYVNVDRSVRFKRTYINGKIDFYTLYIRDFKSLAFTGTAGKGILEIQADADDIMLQTYKDPKGNKDLMTKTMRIPQVNMTPARLDSLRNAFLYIKSLK